jgi:hypothetical protein
LIAEGPTAKAIMERTNKLRGEAEELQNELTWSPFPLHNERDTNYLAAGRRMVEAQSGMPSKKEIEEAIAILR